MNARRTFAVALAEQLGDDATVHPAPTNAASAPCWIIEPDVPYLQTAAFCSMVRRIRLLAVRARTDALDNMDVIDDALDETVAAVLRLEASGPIDGTVQVSFGAGTSIDNLQIGETAYVAAVVTVLLTTP